MERTKGWTGKLGFVAAMAGSAIGLGNIWRFPYIAGENGGGAFLIIYLCIVFTLGLGLVLADMSLGSTSQLPPVKAAEKEFGKKYGLLFYGTVFSSFLLMTIYAIVGGWTLIYAFESMYSHFASGSWIGFGEVISSPTYLITGQALFTVFTAAVLLFGVRNGLEACCKYLMPFLFIAMCVLVVRALTMDGAMAGVEFYLTPDFSKVGPGTVLSALGMAFFSLSLGMGALTTYASYLKKGTGILSSGIWMVVLDTSICFLAGMVVFPSVFAAGLDPSSGPALVFEVLPKIFNALPLGFLFSFGFFILLFFAALTSAISLLEVISAHFIARGNNRKKTVVIVGTTTFLFGIPSALSFNYWSEVQFLGLNIFDMVDKVVTSLLMPINGVIISLLVGWMLSKKASEAWLDTGQVCSMCKPWKTIWINCCRFVFPLAILYIMISGLWEFLS